MANFTSFLVFQAEILLQEVNFTLVHSFTARAAHAPSEGLDSVVPLQLKLDATVHLSWLLEVRP